MSITTRDELTDYRLTMHLHVDAAKLEEWLGEEAAEDDIDATLLDWEHFGERFPTALSRLVREAVAKDVISIEVDEMPDHKLEPVVYAIDAEDDSVVLVTLRAKKGGRVVGSFQVSSLSEETRDLWPEIDGQHDGLDTIRMCLDNVLGACAPLVPRLWASVKALSRPALSVEDILAQAQMVDPTAKPRLIERG